jgi:4-hydroxy 2-oxovalerate aldolase
MSNIEVLDCTLRDGAYIVDAKFGSKTIGGIIKRLQDANINIIECGWLKDFEHVEGTTFYHVPSDLEHYLITEKNHYTTYVAMIDYNRYNLDYLPIRDGKSIDAIRVVFPHGKMKEGLSLVEKIKDKGYKVYLQAANTLAYSDYELLSLVEEINKVNPEGVSIVDTFGAMYPFNLTRIATLLNNNLEKNIKLGFHSHNNQQLSFSLSMQFAQEMVLNSDRRIVIDSSLCGMGRGAGNATTELVANFLNKVFGADYDINIIMDAIDVYMTEFQKNYSWGYSIPNLIAGMYECHVNNVAYLRDTHAVKNKDMKIIFSSLSKEKRRQYDYDNLEKTYMSYIDNVVDDQNTIDKLQKKIKDRNIVAILPGATSDSHRDEVKEYIKRNCALVIGVNSVIEGYTYDYLFFTNEKKYDYAKENNREIFGNAEIIITSNVKAYIERGKDINVVNYNDILKHGWKYYDNSMLVFLRLLKRLMPKQIGIAGFDGYKGKYGEKYASNVIKGSLSPDEVELQQKEIEEMLEDFAATYENRYDIEFITPSPFEEIFSRH